MKLMTPNSNCAAVQGEFMHTCVHTEYICFSVSVLKGFYLVAVFISPMRENSLFLTILPIRLHV